MLERPQADLLDADAAGSDQAQRVDVDRLDVGRSGRFGAARHQLRGDPLRLLVYGGRTIGSEGCLAGQGVCDAGAEQRPVRLGDVEVASEVEQGALADGVAEAFGADQTMGEVGLSVDGAAGLGAPNEHGKDDSRWRRLVQACGCDYGTTLRSPGSRSFRINKLQRRTPRKPAQIDKIVAKVGKLGLDIGDALADTLSAGDRLAPREGVTSCARTGNRSHRRPGEPATDVRFERHRPVSGSVYRHRAIRSSGLRDWCSSMALRRTAVTDDAPIISTRHAA